MRAHTTLIAASLMLACTVDKDPLDGLTLSGAATTTQGSGDGTTGEDPSGPGSTTDDNATTSATSGPAPTTTTAASDPSGDPATSDQGSTGADPTITTTTTTGDPGDPLEAARQLCVDTINMYRATLGLPPYQRWTDQETCSDAEAKSDGETNTPHGAFGMCGEFAQNECPGWPGPPEQSLPGCLAQMWAEGPGEDFNMHGHYINMSSEQYTRVACGFAEVNGEWWMVQNFQ